MAIWTGTISFSLVAIPVQVHAATRDARPELHQVHAADGGRIRHRRICELEQQAVPQHEIARGWTAPDGRVVVLDDEDLAALPLATRHTISVEGFLGTEEVDPLLYERPYWVTPAAQPGAQRPYALLTEALHRAGRTALCKTALRSRERLAVLRPAHGSLVLQTLHPAPEPLAAVDLMEVLEASVRQARERRGGSDAA